MSDYVPSEIVLPYELVIEILARLSIVSLLRFKSVCKSWYSLITSPSFVTKHLYHSKNKLFIRLYHYNDEKGRYLIFRDDVQCGDEFSELEFPYRAPLVDFRLVGSCNGLLCICSFPEGEPVIIIWNPSIRKSVTLPKPQVGLTFVLGFGAHLTTQEYKVVRMYQEHPYQHEFQEYPYPHEFQPLVELYTQGARSWRGLGSTFPPYCFIEYEASQAFVSGAVNWIAKDLRVSVGYRPLIVSFDMSAETFAVLMLPPALADKKPASLSVTLFRESLAVFCEQKTRNNAYCIWVMKDYGVSESWAKLFSFEVNLPIVLDRALGVGENGKVLLSTRDELLLSEGDNRLLSYDTITKTLTDTKIRGCSSEFHVEPFMETLVSVENQGCVLDGQLNPL